MARVAGSSSFYEVGVIDAGGRVKGPTLKLPSVTTILKALPKGGLEWWGHKIGVKGTLDLLGSGELHNLLTGDLEKNTEAVYEKLKQDKKHTPSAVMNKAGGRGTDVHDYAEKLFKEGTLPPKAEIPPEQLPYVEAMWKWWQKQQDAVGGTQVEVVAVEVPLFSLEHGYAGTVDLILKVTLRGSPPFYAVIDFKTSKAIYESHLLQSTAYAHAAQETGLIPHGATTMSSVVRLGADGTYEERPSSCTIEQFLAVKSVYEWLEEMKGEKSGRARTS